MTEQQNHEEIRLLLRDFFNERPELLESLRIYAFKDQWKELKRWLE